MRVLFPRDLDNGHRAATSRAPSAENGLRSSRNSVARIGARETNMGTSYIATKSRQTCYSNVSVNLLRHARYRALESHIALIRSNLDR